MSDAVSSPLCTLLPVECGLDHLTPLYRLRNWGSEGTRLIKAMWSVIGRAGYYTFTAVTPFPLCWFVTGPKRVCVCVCVCVCDGVISAGRLPGSHLPLQVKRMLCFMFAEQGVCEDSEWSHSGMNSNNNLTPKAACSSHLSTKALS